MAGLFILMGALHLATPLLASLFAYLALAQLNFKRGSKWLAVAIFLLLLSAGAYGLGYVINQSIHSLPEIADKAIPQVIQWAKQYQIELPFTDYDSLKDAAMDAIKSQVDYLRGFARIARGATTQLVFLVVGCIVAISVFFHPKFEMGHNSDAAPDNLYSVCCAQIERRFQILYQSFATVMGAQVIIAAINASVTGPFSSGNGTVTPVAFRIASALRKITSSTAPSIALSGEYIRMEWTSGDGCPKRSTRPSRC